MRSTLSGAKILSDPCLKVSGGVEKHRGQGERNFKLRAPYLSVRDMRDIQISYKIGLVMCQKSTHSSTVCPGGGMGGG